ncbi:MAG: hypothetical protein FJZ04_01290 [Candidatus Moranbacteria bacterium]|nr:hypothetical protein [Candidatus Moranbacteria bacterium]
MNSYYYIDVDDEITTVIGKLRQEKSEEIFLVVPKKALIAQSLVNLKLLSKEAEKLSKKIVFASPDANIRKIAQKAGLTVKKYTAKPKKGRKDPPVLAIPAKKKLSPWEEEAAKHEMEAIIGKPRPSAADPSAQIIPPPKEISPQKITQIKPGVYSSATLKEPSAGAPKVVDLKKAGIAKKNISFPQSNPETTLPQQAVPKIDKPAHSRKTAREPNPFKIKKIKSQEEKDAVPLKPIMLERESASLTLKERERLRDLWISQKGSVRAHFLNPKSKLDLTSQRERSEKKELLVEEGRGFLRTTHRRMLGSRKVVDLRLNPPREKAGVNMQKKIFAAKSSAPKTIILPLFNTKVFITFLALLTFVLAILFGVILPKAQVKIVSRVNSQDLEMKIWVNREVAGINQENKTIPGDPIRFELKKEKNFNTTGEREAVERAKGQIIIENSSSEPLSLKQGAKLIDSSGNKYSLLSAVKIPATGSANANTNSNTNTNIAGSSGSASGEITADGTGDKYVLKEGASLSIPGLEDSDFFGLVTARVRKDLVAPSSKKVRFASREDLDGAQKELTAQAMEEGLKELRSRLQDSSQKDFPPEILKIEDSSFTSNLTENQEGSAFQASFQANLFALTFDKNNLAALTKKIIEENQEEKNGTVTVSSYTPVEINPLENKMEISAKINYKEVDTIEAEEVKRQITGKSKKEALEYLRSNRDFSDYTLETWPSWLPGLPLLERRIQIEIN